MNDQERNDFIMKQRAADEARMAANDLRVRYQGAYHWLGSISNEALKSKTFEAFEKSRQPKAVGVVQMFAEERHGTLVLEGPFGVGKTHLLAALCNQLVEAGEHVRFTTAPNLFAAIQHIMANKGDYTDLIWKASTTSLLILDDVDKAKWSEFREEIYFAIIDARATRGLPTALSTNRVTELTNFVGGAVASRLSIGQLVVELSGEDYRPQVK